ncbi:MAG: hypothetical protein Q4P15_08140 [Propionibacteriaceae bacterium]|nr:hypothetical protein [Propionibacteriaceae bacterium]
MVRTLIKHEALRTRGWILVVFGAATLVTLLGLLMEFMPWDIVKGFGFVLSLVATSSLLMVVMVGLAFDYWRSSYKKTGYFTQSLPIKGSTIYGAKLLWGSIVSLVALLLNVVLGVVAVYGGSRAFGEAITFREIFHAVSVTIDALPGWTWALLLVVVLALVVASVGQYYFAASIGSESSMNRLGFGGPILVYFVLYMVMQLLLFVGIIAVPLGLGVAPEGGLILERMSFMSSMVSDQDPNGVPIGFIPVLLVVSAVLIWRTVVSWNKKVSLA